MGIGGYADRLVFIQGFSVHVFTCVSSSMTFCFISFRSDNDWASRIFTVISSSCKTRISCLLFLPLAAFAEDIVCTCFCQNKKHADEGIWIFTIKKIKIRKCCSCYYYIPNNRYFFIQKFTTIQGSRPTQGRGLLLKC